MSAFRVYLPEWEPLEVEAADVRGPTNHDDEIRATVAADVSSTGGSLAGEFGVNSRYLKAFLHKSEPYLIRVFSPVGPMLIPTGNADDIRVLMPMRV